MEGRRDERHGLIVNGRYRSGRGMPMDVVLHDLSKSGCQIQDKLGRLEVDQFLTIRIGQIGPIDAHVRWVDGRKVGIQFDAPLNDAVLDHICTVAQAEPYKPPPEQRPPPPARAVAREPERKKLELDDRERAFAEAIGAIDVDRENCEVLAGLKRSESEWLIGWRRLPVHERRNRSSYHSEIQLAEQFEEAHEQARRKRHPF